MRGDERRQGKHLATDQRHQQGQAAHEGGTHDRGVCADEHGVERDAADGDKGSPARREPSSQPLAERSKDTSDNRDVESTDI